MAVMLTTALKSALHRIEITPPQPMNPFIKPFLWLGFLLSGASLAVQLDPIAPPLKADMVPLTPGLTSGADPIVIDRLAAIQLGKALFWDMNVGSDDVACASCHHHAGADNPIRQIPETAATGSVGTYPARFEHDQCIPLAGQRQRTRRNAPSVINAAYNDRNFWDGRANNLYNGQTAYGTRDPSAGIYQREGERIVHTRLRLENAALASQAMEPPVNAREMSCQGRTFTDIARKLLPRRPLERQAVHPEDSVLATIRHPSGLGLEPVYAELIRRSFAPRYWNDADMSPRPSGLPLLERNFAFFFGLAIQVYESTLIADDTRFDAPRDADGYPEGYTVAEKHGLDVFNRAECDFCHRGPAFTAASHASLWSDAGSRKRVERRVLRVDKTSRTTYTPLSDVGYANIGVAPDALDAGLGSHDPYGHPYSFAAQYLTHLAHPARFMIDPVMIQARDFSLNFRLGFKPDELSADAEKIPLPRVVQKELARPGQGRLPLAVQGAFKIPGLRNVALTGPYFHNGSLTRLEDVIDFYDRGGNVRNPAHFATFVFPQHFSPEDKADLLAFLKTLTDERVRWERAPFDHPALRVAKGVVRVPGQPPRDIWRDIPATGKNGRDSTQEPLFTPITAPFSESYPSLLRHITHISHNLVAQTTKIQSRPVSP